jgi:hypothetical protein
MTFGWSSSRNSDISRIAVLGTPSLFSFDALKKMCKKQINNLLFQIDFLQCDNSFRPGRHAAIYNAVRSFTDFLQVTIVALDHVRVCTSRCRRR